MCQHEERKAPMKRKWFVAAVLAAGLAAGLTLGELFRTPGAAQAAPEPVTTSAPARSDADAEELREFENSPSVRLWAIRPSGKPRTTQGSE